MFLLFLKGFIVGLALAAPAGPLGILCIQRALQAGFSYGFLTGVGAAVGDACYGAIAGFSLVALSNFLTDHNLLVRILGGAFLIFLGVRLATAARYTQPATISFERASPDAFTSGFLLKISHPVTILTFIGIFTGLGLGTAHPNHDHAAILVVGILCGSCAWWLLLCSFANWARDKINITTTRLINRIAGIILVIFGFLALVW